MKCWMNGKYVEEEQLSISPFDHGFLYGLGFFETLRTYKGKAVFLERHYARLISALKEYRIAMPYSIDELREVINRLNEQDGKDGYFRINVSAGEHAIGLAPQQYPTPNVIVFRKELIVADPNTEKEARWLSTPRNSPEQTIRYKSHHYGNNVSARLELPNLAQYEGFFTTKHQLVAEGITSNIFWVKDDILYTPSINVGILPGITRQLILEIADELNIQVEQGLFYKDEVERADECFITNAIQALVPISNIEHIKFLGNQGPMYEKLLIAYNTKILELLGE